jgi:hypothetical protein
VWGVGGTGEMFQIQADTSIFENDLELNSSSLISANFSDLNLTLNGSTLIRIEKFDLSFNDDNDDDEDDEDDLDESNNRRKRELPIKSYSGLFIIFWFISNCRKNST